MTPKHEGDVDATPFNQDDWKEHFGVKWNDFCKNKQTYDPQYLLNTGMNITRPLDPNLANTTKRIEANYSI